MIWLLLIFLVPAGWRLAHLFFGYPAIPKPPETWPERRARVAFENRCHELGQRHFATWNHPLIDGGNSVNTKP